MKQKDVQTCSNCGSQNIGEGEFVGYAQIRKKETMFTSSPVDAYICTDCGNILLLKVRNYEGLNRNLYDYWEVVISNFVYETTYVKENEYEW